MNDKSHKYILLGSPSGNIMVTFFFNFFKILFI